MSTEAMILSIDPGPSDSAYCAYDGQIRGSGWIPNEELINRLRDPAGDVYNLYALESPQAQDRPFGKLFRDTVIWAGRFIEAIESRGLPLIEVDERSVRAHICGSQSANNAALYRSLRDHFGDVREVPCGCLTGSVPGKRPGTTKKCAACNGERFRRIPGPLSRLNEHERSAVAVALYVSQSALSRT